MNDIYRYCNSISVDDMLILLQKPESGITIEGLQNAGYLKVDKLRAKYSGIMEDSIWNNCCDSVQALEDYVGKCRSGVLSGKYLTEATEKLKSWYFEEEETKWNEILQNPVNVLSLLEAFIDKSNRGLYTHHLSEAINFKSQFLADEAVRREQGEYDAFKRDWDSICTTEDLDMKESMIISFLDKYSSLASNSKYSSLINAALSMKNSLKDESVARVDWANIQRSSKIEDYMEFINLHPASQLRSRAEEKVDELKNPLLNDIRLRPYAYSREDMGKYILSGILTRENLVGRGIMSQRSYQHIIDYPHIQMENEGLLPYCEDVPFDSAGNTDVFFFGVPGSGKSCVLGALLSLDGKYGFSFDPAGLGGAGLYGAELQHFVMNSLLPPGTSHNAYPQLINASISRRNNKGTEETHYLSIIDMPGEKTASFASMDPDTINFEELGEGAASLFNNDNQKMLFFVIDPLSLGKVDLSKYMSSITQVNVLNRVSSLLEKSPDLMKKVISIHIILTKSDTIGGEINEERLSEIFRNQNYDSVLDKLNRLCRKYHVNARQNEDYSVHVTPFCLGKFEPGETYVFNSESAKSLLQVILNNTTGIADQTFIGSVKDWFNK